MSAFKIVGLAARAAVPAAKLKKATQEIEAIFVKDLIAAMRKTAKHQSLGSTMGGDMYQDMLDQALSESASKSGALGISQTIFRQMAPHSIRAALGSASVSARASTEPHLAVSLRGQDALANREQDAPVPRGPDGRATQKP